MCSGSVYRGRQGETRRASSEWKWTHTSHLTRGGGWHNICRTDWANSGGLSRPPGRWEERPTLGLESQGVVTLRLGSCHTELSLTRPAGPLCLLQFYNYLGLAWPGLSRSGPSSAELRTRPALVCLTIPLLAICHQTLCTRLRVASEKFL